ncbi:MAG: HD-GYP domain-containing protein [Deferribacterales bacterium]
MQKLSETEKISGLTKGYWKSTFLLSIITIVLLSLSAAAISNIVRIQQFKKETVALINNFEAKQLDFDLNNIADDPAVMERTWERISPYLEMFELVEVKIWTKEMRTVFSVADKDTVGKYYAENKELKKALSENKVIMALDSGEDMENMSLRKYNLMLEMYVPLHENGRIHGVLEVYRKAPGLQLFGRVNIFAGLIVLILGVLFNLLISTKFRYAMKTIFAYQETLVQANEDIATSYHHSVVSLAKALELRDMETEGHCERVVNMSVYIGKKMGLDKLTLGKLAVGAYLHDVGKIGIPDSILLKPARLTAEERDVMETHVSKGYDIIKNVPFLMHAEEIVKYHHEKYNGKGYPFGLKGEDIPVTARIFALVDVFDALISKRPYKDPMPLDQILKIIREERGEHFCPKVADIILNMSEEELMGINRKLEASHITEIVNDAVMRLLEHDFKTTAMV